MEFTVHSLRDIESWLAMHRRIGMDIDLHFHLKSNPDIGEESVLIDQNPDTDNLLDRRLKNSTEGIPLDWVKEKKTGRYFWKEDITSEENTPDRLKYIGAEEADVWRDYQNSASNGISGLYRKYLGAPDIDRGSFTDARNEDLKGLVKEILML